MPFGEGQAGRPRRRCVEFVEPLDLSMRYDPHNAISRANRCGFDHPGVNGASP